MTYVGAKENTAAEMAKVMHFTLGQDQLHPAFAELLKEMNGADLDPGQARLPACGRQRALGPGGLSLEGRLPEDNQGPTTARG